MISPSDRSVRRSHNRRSAERGITDPLELKTAEADVTGAAIFALGVESLPGSYDLEHLRSFHRRIFGRLYAWAGEIGTVTIAKTDMF